LTSTSRIRLGSPPGRPSRGSARVVEWQRSALQLNNRGARSARRAAGLRRRVAQAEGQRPGEPGVDFQAPPRSPSTNSRTSPGDHEQIRRRRQPRRFAEPPASGEKATSPKNPRPTRRDCGTCPPPAAGRAHNSPADQEELFALIAALEIVSPAAQARSPIHAPARRRWSALESAEQFDLRQR